MAGRRGRIIGDQVELIAPFAAIFEEGVESIAEAVLISAGEFFENLRSIAEEVAADIRRDSSGNSEDPFLLAPLCNAAALRWYAARVRRATKKRRVCGGKYSHLTSDLYAKATGRRTQLRAEPQEARIS